MEIDRRNFIKTSAIMAAGISASQILSANSITPGKYQRSIYKILSSTNSNMGRMGLKNIIQGDYQNYVSPFFLLDEFGPMELPKGAPFRVDAHPHAGIIPTTYLLKGNAHHRDSMDNDFQYKEGDFIQFTSGKGALHMEETGDELFKEGGVFHGMQGWLNIPPVLKKSEPQAYHSMREHINTVEKESATIKVILGEIFGTTSTTQLLMPVIYWHVFMKEHSSLELPIPANQNSFVYLLNGRLEAHENQIESGQTILYERDGDFIKLKATTKAEFLVLGGEVNNEPYVAHGPFVVNTQKELEQAYSDFQQGKFGDLEKTNGVKRKLG